MWDGCTCELCNLCFWEVAQGAVYNYIYVTKSFLMTSYYLHLFRIFVVLLVILTGSQCFGRCRLYQREIIGTKV